MRNQIGGHLRGVGNGDLWGGFWRKKYTEKVRSVSWANLQLIVAEVILLLLETELLCTQISELKETFSASPADVGLV